MKGSGRAALVGAGAAVFCALAIANAAGYRYGVSDLAFYLPAAFRSAEPALFPRDGALLDVQSRLTLADEAISAALRGGAALGLGAPATVYALHLGSLLLLYGAGVALGRTLFRSPWSVAAFVAVLTLRHAVARTGVNTLEGYFHPRVVAFALGALALAVFLRRGVWPALILALLATAMHTTTGFWFLIFLGVAGLVGERRDRVALLALAIVAAGLFAAAIAFGPLAGRLRPMDAAWLAVIAEKDYLFPDLWPAWAWIACAAYVAVILAAAAIRRRAGELTSGEAALLTGAGALLVAFLVLLPPLAARGALAVQMQPSRIFWLLDLLATAGLVWMVEHRARAYPRAPAVLAVLLLALSTVRGVYLLTVRFPERSLAAVTLAESPWRDAMRWAASSDARSHWLAHPYHAVLYGESLRVSARRDVLVEATKDPAVAMYDRAIAMRVADRLRASGDFDALSAEQARDLARRYDLDFLITEIPLPLPVAYRNAQFFIYGLR
ncbi:MAG TPA: hypothetical protein VK886_17985 [Vicinamibacterales bacterium]|nr:hypothetical protein [Vicinamibacterales bacterium]